MEITINSGFSLISRTEYPKNDIIAIMMNLPEAIAIMYERFENREHPKNEFNKKLGVKGNADK